MPKDSPVGRAGVVKIVSIGVTVENTGFEPKVLLIFSY